MRQAGLALGCEPYDPRTGDATSPAKIEDAIEQTCAKAAGEMRPTFAPIKTGPADRALCRLQGGNIDLKF